MSADNGVYILVTAKQGDDPYELEYRVAYNQGSFKNGGQCNLSDAAMLRVWGDSDVFLTLGQAKRHGKRIARDFIKGGGYLEYGVCRVWGNCYFPQGA